MSKMRVLVTHLSSSAGGNPGLQLLFQAVRESGEVQLESYSTRAVLTQRWDIIHIYWAEWMIRRKGGRLLTSAGAVKVLAALRFAKARGAKIVWTANNIRPHETDSRGFVTSFVQAVTRLADQVICPSQTVLDQFQYEYPAICGLDQRVVPIGSYKGIYSDEKRSPAESRKILDLPQDARIVLVFGMVRPYKNVPQVLRCYGEVVKKRKDTFLLVAGKPLNQATADDIQETCADLPNVRADLRHIPDEEIQDYVRASNCLLVSTSFALTTGMAMLSLTFDRPVLLPNRGAAIDIRDAIGDEWVHTYEGGIRPAVMDRAFNIEQPEGSPALEEHYDWTRAGRQYYAAYSYLTKERAK
jgi:beta-1,4-mannosyltransferase